MRDLLIEIIFYLKVRKKFWLLPILIMMFILGVIIILAESSGLSPFIYTIF